MLELKTDCDSALSKDIGREVSAEFLGKVFSLLKRNKRKRWLSSAATYCSFWTWCLELWQPFYDHQGRQPRKANKLMLEEHKTWRNLGLEWTNQSWNFPTFRLFVMWDNKVFSLFQGKKISYIGSCIRMDLNFSIATLRTIKTIEPSKCQGKWILS